MIYYTEKPQKNIYKWFSKKYIPFDGIFVVQALYSSIFLEKITNTLLFFYKSVI